jgi:hypothetical protein
VVADSPNRFAGPICLTEGEHLDVGEGLAGKGIEPLSLPYVALELRSLLWSRANAKEDAPGVMPSGGLGLLSL